MRNILRRLNSVSGMRGSLVVTPDGLPIAVDLPSDMPVEAAAGLSASIGKMLADWSDTTGAGAMKIGMIEAQQARLFVSHINWGYLVAIAEKHCPLGEARIEMRTATTQINDVCQQLKQSLQEEEAQDSQ